MENAIGRVRPTTVWNKNFICIVITNAMLSMSSSSVNTLVASYAGFLKAAPLLIGMMAGMFFAIAFIARPFTGSFTAKMDKRKLMIVFYALGIIVHLGYSLFLNVPAFILFRVLHGIEYSMIGALNMAIAGDNLPFEKMGSGMGIFGMGTSVSMALGPMIGLALRDLGLRVGGEGLGYSLVFGFGALVMLIGLIPCFILSPQKLTKDEIGRMGAWYKNIMSVEAIPAAILMALVSFGYNTYNSYIVSYGNTLGIMNIGMFFTVLAAFIFAARPLCGYFTDKYGLRVMLIPGPIIFAASFFIVAKSQTLPMILVGAAVAAIGYGMSQPAIQAMCIQSVSPLKSTVASNTNYAGTDIGFFFGPLVGSMIFSNFGYPTMFMATMIPTALTTVAFLIFWPAYKARREKLVSEFSNQTK